MDDQSQATLSYERRLARPGPIKAILKVGLCAIIVIALIGGACYVVDHQIKAFRERRAIAAVLQLQQACLDYVMQPGMVVYDDGPDAAKRYPRPPYSAGVGDMSEPREDIAAFHPPELDAAVDSVRRRNRRLGDRYANGSIAFMHEMPAGTQKLLTVVQVQGRREDGEHPRMIRVYRIQPLTAANFASHRPDRLFMDVPIQLWPLEGDSLTVFAVRRDPSDPTHIIVPFRAGTQTGELHLWIKPDGGVKFRSTVGVTVDEVGLNRDGGRLYLGLPPTGIPIEWRHRGLD